MKNVKYENLFSPLKVNGVMLRNRIIAAPVNAQNSAEKMQSLVGMIVLGDGFVSDDPRARIAKIHSCAFSKDRLTARKTKARLEFAKQGGAIVSTELLHCGEYGLFLGSDYVYGNKAGIREHDGAKIIEITEEIMEKICDEYFEAAKMAKELGFDMVTAHFAHGWLASQYLSTTWNRREDASEYENRIKFPKMILQSIRKAVGRTFPIDMRINGKDWVGNGTEPELVARFLEDMAQEGLVDMANISCGTDMDIKGQAHMSTLATEKHMPNIEIAKFIKERVSIPITVVGAIETPEEAEMIIREGYADAVWLGRALVADPKWATKAYEDRAEDIVPCLRCSYCVPKASEGRNFGCSVNPRLNKEEQFPLDKKAEKTKKVVVIGGGPAGIRAALEADRLGHEVILLEKSYKLGGLITFTNYVESKIDLNRYLKYLIIQIEKSNVKIKLNFEANFENVSSLEPDVLMIAVGSKPFEPNIKGKEQGHVLNALDVFDKLDSMAQNIAIIGGGTIGCELAIDFAKLSKNVTVVEMTGELNSGANVFYKFALDEKMSEYESIKTMTNACCQEIKEKTIIVERDGEIIEIKAENVIMATGLAPKKDLAHSFYGITPETYILGDCNKVGIIKNASEDGFYFANNV